MRTTIEQRLIGNGNLIEVARLKGIPILPIDRRVIGRVRQEAIDAGLSSIMINALEMEGERGRAGVFGYGVTARFIGAQEICFRNWKMRLYNIEGDHRLNHSTVSVTTLVLNGIMPPDLSFPQTVANVTRENAFFVVVFFEHIWSWIRQ